jgi:hypothetical protein
MNKAIRNPPQARLSLKAAQRKYLSNAAPCPTCGRPAKQLSWFYFASKGGWVTFCSQCEAQVDFFLERREYYPWQLVDSYRHDQHFQGQHSQEDAKAEYLSKATPCPRCRRPAKQLSWFYFGDFVQTPKTAGWMTVCDPCDLQVDFFLDRQEYYPWSQVEALRNDADLQSRHPPERAQEKHLQRARSCPRCGTTPGQLSWLFFADTEQTPEFLTTGWLVVCDPCRIQTDFLDEARLRQYAWERVDACRQDEALQSQHPPTFGGDEHLAGSTTCPLCGAPAERLSWVYFDDHPVPPGWLGICDRCHAQVELLSDESAAHYSWQLVNAARNDQRLQEQHSPEDARRCYGHNASPCPKCNTPAERLAWFYFSSPEQDWRALAGRAGWMTVCDQCNLQVDFSVEVLS